MTKLKRLITLAFILIASGLISVGFFSAFFTKAKPLSISKSDNYIRLWKRVDSCENKGLTESAIKIIEVIYEKAKSENNAPQFVKAILHKMKFESYKEEYSLEKTILNLREETSLATFPIKPVLQSILADAYWQYYQNNRWKFYNRTTTVNFKNDDINTWDLRTITYAAIQNHKAALSNIDSLKLTKVELYDDIIDKGTKECRSWRPTLYDFLGHRALSFFMNSEVDITRPSVRFTVNDSAYLKAYPEFSNFPITNPSDSLETKYYALKLLQALTQFHMNDQDPEALIDVELIRLDYIYKESQNAKKDTLYLSSLSALSSKFAKNPRVTEIDFRVATWYLQKAADYIPLNGEDFKWHKKTAKTLCESSIAKFPDSYGAALCKNLIATIESKAFNLEIEEVNGYNKPFRALVSSQNISKVYFKVVKTSHQELKSLYRKHYNEKLFDKLNNLPLIKTFDQNIPDDGDYQNHKLEIKMPELPYGYYVILSSLTPDFKYLENITSYTELIISDLTTIERARDNGTYDFFVMNRETGEAVKNADVQVWHEKYNYKLRDYEYKKGENLKTDDKGYFQIRYTTGSDRSFFVEISNGEDTYFNNNSYYSYKRNTNENIQIRSNIFTDRAIYRPGQTVYFKSIVLEGINNDNFKIKPNYPVTVVFYDVNYQKVAEQKLTTNEYGTVNGSFTAPQGVLNGQMHISDGHGTTYLSVEDYKRPKFEVTFNPVKGSYKINDDIVVTGIAKAYAGNLIDGAKVNYRVVRKVNYPYWWGWYRSYYRSIEETEITSGESLTNDTGAFIINFKALPDESVSKASQATYNYEIHADVVDINGETHSAQTDVTVGYQALTLSIQTEEIINQSKIKPFIISTQNLNGVAEAAKGNFKIYKLKQPSKLFRTRTWPQPDRHVLSQEEYYKTFPVDLYADELNKYKWEKDIKLVDKDFNTAEKTEYTLSEELKNLKAGYYLIEASCRDKYGEEVKTYSYFSLFNPSQKQAPEISPQWFYASKHTAEPKESISYILYSSYPSTNYLFELEHKGKIIETKVLPGTMQLNEIPIKEEFRGNVSYHTTFIKNNRFYSTNNVISVPYTNKELDIEFATFRNKLLPGQEEEWKLIIKDKKGDKAVAELMATMYDASLDAFSPNYWFFNVYQQYYSHLNWNSTLGKQTSSRENYLLKNKYAHVPYRNYDNLNYFGLYFYNNYRYGHGYYEDGIYPAAAAEVTSKSAEEAEADYDNQPSQKKSVMREKSKNSKGGEDKAVDETTTLTTDLAGGIKGNTGKEEKKEKGDELSNVKARSNFNETAFFYPTLETNEKGETVIKFKIPESLTKWKVLGLAHTKDLKIGQFEKEVITQKELMVIPNAPRFFREGDKLTFISKISNLSEKDLSGEAELKLYDALTDKEISFQMIEALSGKFPTIGYREFSVKKGLSTSIEWNLMIPQDLQAVKFKIVAKAGNYSDGEETALPVLTNRMLVTESMPLPIRSNQTKDFSFTKFINQNNHSTTLKNYAYTLEFTANPAWYAVQALPYLMEYPYECAEQTFARYYANTLASYVVNSKPKIKQIFDAWKLTSSDAFLSNLEKNQELKAVVLEETPWVLNAKNESENKKRVGLLFDLNKMSNELARAFKKLKKAQTSNGGFWWFEGGPDDWYITQHITTGFGHLDKLGAIKSRDNSEIWNMITNAVEYCDNRMREEYEWMKKHNPKYKSENHLSYTAIHYLYMRSFFTDISVPARHKEHLEYYKKQEQTYWLDQGRYMQGMIALSLHRYLDVKTPKDIMKSVKENSLNNEEMGMYWKENYGYYWYQAPIEMQALMIEAFDEVMNDTKSVDDLKTWLIKSKQTQHWGTTRSTTEAVYAMLLKGGDWLATEPNVEIQVGEIKLDPKNDPSIKAEAGTGYFKKVWKEGDIKPQSMGKIKVIKKDEGVSYGSVYWQYFEQLDKITPHETPLKLKKQLFLQKNTVGGPVITPITSTTKLKLGDKIKVRIELRVDRDMSYVHMKDMRAAGFEPTNVFSGYKWQDGLGYYESTKDAATNFFFSYLSKGTYVFEYPLVVNHYGDFSNGVTTIQCMYAPEFTSHSEGIRVQVVK